MLVSVPRAVRLLSAAALFAALVAGVTRAGDAPPAQPKPKAAAASHAPEESAPPRDFDTYALVILRTGPVSSDADTPENQKLFHQHLGHLKKMARLGKLVVAGPLGNQPDPTMRGIALYKTSLAEARQLAEQDPAVQAGHLKVDVMTWATEKGALAFPLAAAMSAPSKGP